MKGSELAKLAAQYPDYDFEFVFTDGCGAYPGDMNVRTFENLELCDIGHSDKVVSLTSEKER